MDKPNRILAGLVFALTNLSLYADLSAPAWYDEGPAVADWHYRAPLSLPPGGAINSTIQLDVDFNSLLTQLGVDSGAVTIDSNSVRVVRSNGSLSATQEYTDVVFAGILDAANNNRGEVRFLLQDAPGSGAYYLYFDILANGAKPVSPSTTLNGNFEHSAGATPSNWVQSAQNAGGNQNSEVYQSSGSATINISGGCSSGGQANVDNSPNNLAGIATGQSWHLLGYRDNCEDGSGNERIRLAKTITVPAGAAAGNLQFFFQVQGWDGIQSNNNYDWFVFSVNGTAVNHNSLSIDNSTSPTLRIDNNRLGRVVYSTTFRDHGWKQATLDLSPYQGSTISFRIESRHSASDNAYRSWIKLDDLSWSVQSASLGTAEGFGINITTPNDTTTSSPSQYTASQTLSIAVQLDATPQSLTADIYDDAGTQVATGVLLFDDGSHGDTTANDGLYFNDGSIPGEPTYTILNSDPGGNNWLIRAFALDASTSGIGGTNGLLHRNGQANTPLDQSNFFNIDEQLFTVNIALLEIDTNIFTVSDPINGTDNPKAIPGASLRYELSITNLGPNAADNSSIIIIEALPAEVSLCVSNACSGAADPVFYDDTGTPVPTGITFNYAADVRYSTDGISYNSSTTPDADGYDSSITHLRVIPSGTLAAPDVGGNPEFRINYVVRLK